MEKRKFAFDWGGSLENNESLRQIARDLFQAGYEVYIVPAIGMSGGFPYELALQSINVPYTALHIVYIPDFSPPQAAALPKLEMCKKLGCNVLYDDNQYNLQAARENSIEAVEVQKDPYIVPRPQELLAENRAADKVEAGQIEW